MLVELIDAGGEPIWVNPAFVKMVCGSVMSEHVTYICMHGPVPASLSGTVQVQGTLSEIVEKLNS